MYSCIEQSISSIEVDRLYVNFVHLRHVRYCREFQFHMGEIPASHSRLFM